jgi:hypothetical protein
MVRDFQYISGLDGKMIIELTVDGQLFIEHSFTQLAWMSNKIEEGEDSNRQRPNRSPG